MRTQLNFGFAVMIVLLLSFAANAQKTDESSKSKIQVALLLDTSNSMDGLIDQAKTELWSVVNELATAKYEGERPELEIALYEYGNDGLESADGYIRKVSNFTTDLDEISELLFSLKTYGGYEFCGQVIGDAADELEWTDSHSNLKMIVIAGNEEFTQGTVDYKKTCKNAVSKGIVINTIFCGDRSEGIRTMWKDGADLADGKYMNIDQNQEIAYIETPYDSDILRLNQKLNKTYIAYGQEGEKNIVRQEAQDMNASQMNRKASVGRAVSKSSAAYKNAHWDLVDAAADDDFDLSEISTEQLPAEMKNMSTKERKEYIEKKKKERSKIQSEIQSLNDKREAFILKQRKEDAQEATLGSALIKIVREQAQDKGYKFEK
jgi:hypothetical protein